MGTLADFKAVCNGLGCNWLAMNPVWGHPQAAHHGEHWESAAAVGTLPGHVVAAKTHEEA